MTNNDPLAYAEMSMALMRPEDPKVFCTSSRRNNRGRITHACTMHVGHENAHRDTHSAATWS